MGKPEPPPKPSVGISFTSLRRAEPQQHLQEACRGSWEMALLGYIPQVLVF